MVTSVKSRVGTGTCICCGRDVPAKENAAGTLSMACHWCDFPAYAKRGTEAHRILSARVKREPGEAPQEPEKKPPAAVGGGALKPVVKPEAPRAAGTRIVRSVWDFGGAN